MGQLQRTPQGYEYRRYRCNVCGRCSINADKLEHYVHKTLANALAIARLRAKLDPGGVEDARARLKRARDAKKRLSLDTRARDLMGDDNWYAALEKHAAEEAAAQRAYGETSTKSARAVNVPPPNQLHKPEQFARALGAMVDRIPVVPGRGTIEGRATIVSTVLDHEGRPWVLTP